MLWEGRPLRDIGEDDIRKIIASSLAEHLQLEYKSAPYTDDEHGKKEFLLDICMFANTIGGLLLIGIPELLDNKGKQTGMPDPNGSIGLDIDNPEDLLARYDARVMEAIEERLTLESAPIRLASGKVVLAIRVPNSLTKPHSARHLKHTYFTARRERQRHHLSVREIKELVMRTASRIQESKNVITSSLDFGRQRYLTMAMVPVFFEDFMVELRSTRVYEALQAFSLKRGGELNYSFDGLELYQDRAAYVTKFFRNGLLTNSVPLAIQTLPNEELIRPQSIDMSLRKFVQNGEGVYKAADISAPFVLGMKMRLDKPLVGMFPTLDGYEMPSQPILARDYPFPVRYIDSLDDIDDIIRPLCDQAHQMFGKEGSHCFDANGKWCRG